MAKFREKIEARKIRLKGGSISEIARKLSLSKSTVSSWCKDIQLTAKQIGQLSRRQLSASYKGRLKAAEQKRKNRLVNIEKLRQEGIKEIGKINQRELFLAGLGIYWGEGYKSLSTAAFTSQDPKLTLFMIKWFREICQIPMKDLILRVGLNIAHKHRVKIVEKYWSELAEIPLKQFTKTTLIKTKVGKIYENSDNYYGTLRISVRRSCCLQRKILGWLEGLSRAQ